MLTYQQSEEVCLELFTNVSVARKCSGAIQLAALHGSPATARRLSSTPVFGSASLSVRSSLIVEYGATPGQPHGLVQEPRAPASR